MVGLGELPGGTFESRAYGATPGGGVVVGASVGTDGLRPFRWTPAVGLVDLGDLPGGDSYARANALSDDGNVGGRAQRVGGERIAHGGLRLEARRRARRHGRPPGRRLPQRIVGMTPDGVAIVGKASSASGGEAFRWTAATGMVGLGVLPGGSLPTRGLAVSGDGRVVVGTGMRGGQDVAFVWDAEHGMRALADALHDDLGLDLTGWSLGEARGISRDGTRIVGVGFDPNGFLEAFQAVILACTNDRDDDGDGLRDWDGAGVGAPDPQCIGTPSKTVETEQAAGCGLGVELGLLGLVAARWRRVASPRGGSRRAG